MKGLSSKGSSQAVIDLKTCDSYTTACPPVRGENPRALASAFFSQADGHTMV